MIGHRNLRQLLRATTGKQHYIALLNMAKIYPDFLNNLYRYLTARGTYPYQIRIKTPVGVIAPTAFSHHDLLTVNEIFCRNDYWADNTLEVVVDLGSNIGISALYFLTRNQKARCYLYEPDRRNTNKLRANLAGFEARYALAENAVADEGGILEFGIEESGRYGGLGLKTGKTIKVECLAINEVLAAILQHESLIDILKIDTEGVEITTVEAIKPEFLERIRYIYLEAAPKERLHPDIFTQTQYGSVCRLTNMKLAASPKYSAPEKQIDRSN